MLEWQPSNGNSYHGYRIAACVTMVTVYEIIIHILDNYMKAMNKLHVTVSRAYKIHPAVRFEVFTHRVDGLSDDHVVPQD